MKTILIVDDEFDLTSTLEAVLGARGYRTAVCSNGREALECIRQTRPDYVFILPWNLKDEIMQQLSFIREWGGRFVVPIPEVRIYE